MMGRIVGVSLFFCLAGVVLLAPPAAWAPGGPAGSEPPVNPSDSAAAVASFPPRQLDSLAEHAGAPVAPPDSGEGLGAIWPDSASGALGQGPGPLIEPAPVPEDDEVPALPAAATTAPGGVNPGEEQPAGGVSAEASGAEPEDDELLELGVLPVTDTFGFIATWRAALPGPATVRPFERAVRADQATEPALERLRRRFGSRWFLREHLGFKPELFNASDSIAVRVDAMIDSLVAGGQVAEGVFCRTAQTGGQRFHLPFLPPLQSSRGAPAKPAYTVSHSVNIDRATVTPHLLRDGVPVVRPVPLSYADYMLHVTRVNARRLWAQAIAESQREATIQGGRTGLVRLTVPFEMPTAVKSIFGEGKPNLLVSGSEHISFGGRSQWFPHRPSYEYGRQQSKFPQLQMQQDLNIRLKGSVGDKLDVDVDQSSQAQSSLANRIQIHYKGYEDEIIRRVDLGNTSLSLPGTEYVSYGGKHTGLFGISSEAQLGPLTLNMIVSKQEGQTVEASTTIRSERSTAKVYDYEYVRDRFFFADDPTRDAYPNNPRWVVSINSASFHLWMDDGNGWTQGETGTRKGVAVLDLAHPVPTAAESLRTGLLYFEELQPGIDYALYTVDERYGASGSEVHPYIVLYRHLEDQYTLGVTYRDDVLGTDVGGLSGDTLYVKMIRPNRTLLPDDLTTEGWGKTSRLMLSNVYAFGPGADDWAGDGLPEGNILKEDLKVTLRYDGTIGDAEDPDQIDGVKLIRYLGLDYRKDLGSEYIEGQDDVIDIVPWVDLKMGLIFFPDLRPFAPLEAINDPGHERTFDLRGRPGNPADWDSLPDIYWNREIYSRKGGFVRNMSQKGTGVGRTWDSKYYMEIEYKTPVSGVRVDAYDIIEGSEVVSAGQRRLSKGRDYEIDYQTGEIRILDAAAVTEDQEINVSYKRASAFGMASKSLLGAAAFFAPENSKLKLSTSWLYERKSSPDRRPRLGSEPTRAAVGEVAASYTTESMAITRLLDKLPLLDARRPSTFDFGGGLGMSFPNPNTRNDLYLDDFEGVDDNTNIRINRLSWVPCSVPHAVAGGDIEARSNRRGELWWYTPYHAVQEGDMNPTLDLQEANDYTQVLELQFFPYASSQSPQPVPTGPWGPEESWGGIIQGLTNTKLDLTGARFLDIWVNDWVTWDEFQTDPTKREGVLHIDIGQMDENSLWQRRKVDCSQNPPVIIGEPIPAPNDSLDYEDQDRDGQLDFSDTVDEDTGLDRIKQGSSNAGNDYYFYDSDKYADRALDEDEICDAFSQINGTEHNGRLDTEDLDGNNTRDPWESYYAFRIDLNDTSVVDVDVSRDYQGKDINWPEALTKGWRRIRITLSDAQVDSFIGNPSWTEVKHLRLWLSGFSSPRRLQIGSIQLRGNRWLAAGIRDSTGREVPAEELEWAAEEFYPGVVNNKEDSDIYYAPFEEYRDRSQNSVREREQSLTLEMRNFQPGHTGRIYSELRGASGGQTTSGLNLMSYEYLEFYVGGTVPQEEAGGAEFFVRLCKEARQDTTHYYEYAIPLPSNTGAERVAPWKKVKIPLTDLSDLKLLSAQGADEFRQSPIAEDGSRYRMRGTPYLTSIGRITIGVRNGTSGEVVRESAVWIDELRLTHVLKDVGYAYRLKLNSQLSDFARVDLSYRHVGTEFTSISAARTEKASESAFQAAVSLPIDRFTPRAARLNLPLTYNYSRSERIPKYRTRDDILVGDDPTDRDITRTTQRSASLGISRQRSGSRWLQYTVDALKVNLSHRENNSQQPYGRDCSRTATMQVGYSADFGGRGDIKLHRKLTVNPMLTNISINLNRSETEEEHCERLDGSLNNPLFKNAVRSRTTSTGGLSFGTGLRPIKPVNYTFSQSRDLKRRQDFLGGLNIGSEVARDENLAATYALRLIKGWIEPRLTWKGSFKGQFDQQQGSKLDRSDNLSNDQTTTVSGDLPLNRLIDWLGGLTASGGKSGGQPEQPQGAGGRPAESGPGGQDAGGGERDRQSSRRSPPGVQPEEKESRLPPGDEEAAFTEPDRGPDDVERPESLPGTRPQGAQTGRSGGGRGQGAGATRGALFKGFLGVTRTSGSFNQSKRSTFRKTTGEPAIAYQLGLSRSPGVDILPEAQINLQDSYGYQLDGDLRLLRRITVATKLSHTETEQRALGKTTGSAKTDWPDLDIRWGELSQWVNYHGWFRSVKATTRYTRSENQTLQEGNLSRRDLQARWGPLLDLTVTIRNGMTFTMRLDRNSGREETHDPLTRSLQQTNENGETKLNLSTKRTFNVTRTITMPLTGTQERITTRLDVGLQVGFETRKRTLTRAGGRPNVTLDKRLFDFAVNGSYQFTKTVTGKVVINFGEDADNENKTNTRRYVEVRLTAGFSF